MATSDPPKIYSDYPCGPCPSEQAVTCHCGAVIEPNEHVAVVCDDPECECCTYCGRAGCPRCGAHLHCGGCI